MIDVKDIILDIPTKPTITKKVGNNNEDWTNGSIIQIKKDAKSRSGVKYYLYCVNKEKNSNSCEWKKAQSKNIEVKDNGTNYVFIKGVNENGKEGKVSDPIEVKNDKQEPLIIKVKKDATETTIKVAVEAEDKESGIDRYYYKIDDGEYKESKNNKYTFKNLEEDTEYTITIKVVDKVGNEKEITFKVRTLKKDKKNEENKEKDENKTDQKENESSKKDNEETKKKDTKENNKNDKDEEKGAEE